MALLFINKVKTNQQAFEAQVKAISKKYSINPNWLMALMNSETGGTFNPSIWNTAGSGAVGLIQFMPSTARELGTTTNELASLSNVQQLYYVDKYIALQMKYFKIDKIKDYDDLYLIVFYPKAVGKPDNWVFPLTGTGYLQNAGIDFNKDGVLTVADFKNFIRAKIPANMISEFTARFRYSKQVFFVVVTMLLLSIVYFFVKTEDNRRFSY